MPINAESGQLPESFVKNARILFCISSKVVRSGIRSSIKELGCSMNQVKEFQLGDSTENYFNGENPNIIILESSTENHFSLEEKEAFFEKFGADAKTACLVICEGETEALLNLNESRIGKNLIGEMIPKPFSLVDFKKSLKSLIIEKNFPTKYNSAINFAREKIRSKDFQSARQLLQKSAELKDSPIETFYLLGHLGERTRNFKFSLDCFARGISMKSNSFDCHMGLFKSLIGLNRKNEAFEKGNNIIKQFSTLGPRITDQVRLAIDLHKYEEIAPLVKLYLDSESRCQDLDGKIVSLLVLAGHRLIEAENTDLAKQCFEKSCLLSSSPGFTCLEITKLLIESEKIEIAEHLLRKFEEMASSTDQPEFKKMNLEIMDRICSRQMVINEATQLISSGIKDLRIFELAISSCRELGLSQRGMDLSDKAKKLFPDEKERIEGLTNSTSLSKSEAENDSLSETAVG